MMSMSSDEYNQAHLESFPNCNRYPLTPWLVWRGEKTFWCTLVFLAARVNDRWIGIYEYGHTTNPVIRGRILRIDLLSS